MSNPAVAYVGEYSFQMSDLDDNNKKRYILAYQKGKSVLDKELTENVYRDLDFLKRYFEKNVGDSVLSENSFKIEQSSITTSNNFKISGGTTEKPAMLIVKGFPLLLFSDIEFNQQNNSGLLTDDNFTETVIPAISSPIADRIDTVFVDTYLAEVSCENGSEYLDTSIKDIDLNLQTANRFRIVQDVLVVEDSVNIPVDGYDSNNVYHRYYKLAQIQRHSGIDDILTADITDFRKVVSTLESISDGTGNIHVKNAIVNRQLNVTCNEAVDALILNKTNSGQALLINSGTMKFALGVGINEFSNDGTMAGNSDLAVPTEKAVATFLGQSIGGLTGGSVNRLAKFINAHSIADSSYYSANNINWISYNTPAETLFRVSNSNDFTGESVIQLEARNGNNSLTLRQYNATSGWSTFNMNSANSSKITSTGVNFFIEAMGTYPIYFGNNGFASMMINGSSDVKIIRKIGINKDAVTYNMELLGAAEFENTTMKTLIGDVANQSSVSVQNTNMKASICDVLRQSAFTIEVVPDLLSGLSFASGAGLVNKRFAFNLTNIANGNFYISRFNNSGVQLDSAINPTFIIDRATGFIGINTSTFRGSNFESLLTLHKNNSIRILGEEGTYKHGGTIHFGDGTSTYIKEYDDDFLEMHAANGTYISSIVGINAEPDSDHQLLVNGNTRLIVGETALNICYNDNVLESQKLNSASYESVVWFNVNVSQSTFYTYYPYTTGETIKLTTNSVLPEPLYTNTIYYVIVIDDNHIRLADSHMLAMAGSAIALINQGSGSHVITKQQVITNHNVMSTAVSSPVKRWSIGFINEESVSNRGSDFYISRYNDAGLLIDNPNIRTFVIDRKYGNVGIMVSSPQYPLDVNGDARFGNDVAGNNIFASKLIKLGLNDSAIGATDAIFDESYLREIHSSKIMPLYVYEGGNNSITLDVGGYAGSIYSVSYFDAFEKQRHFVLSTDRYNITSSSKWSWVISGLQSVGNAGSNLVLYRHDNNGNELDAVVTFKRSHGYVGIKVADPQYPLDVTVGRFSESVRSENVLPVSAGSFIGSTGNYFSQSHIDISNVSTIKARPIGGANDGYLKIIHDQDGTRALSTVTGQAGRAGTPAGAHVRHWIIVAGEYGGFSESARRWSTGIFGQENGSNNGSHYAIWRHDDSGNEIDAPVIINRMSGNITIEKSLIITTGGTVFTNRIRSNSGALNVASQIAFEQACTTDFTANGNIKTNDRFYERTRTNGIGYWTTLTTGDVFIKALALVFSPTPPPLGSYSLGYTSVGLLLELSASYIGDTIHLKGCVLFQYNLYFAGDPDLYNFDLGYENHVKALVPVQPVYETVVGTCRRFNQNIVNGVVTIQPGGAVLTFRMTTPTSRLTAGDWISFSATYQLANNPDLYKP